ncbi:MAG: GNAT family N-acetyltransferase [Negativicutes bacterium]|nr:GNAT family N-acetyltransferase [Negativicutes bacterium]
MIEAAEGDDFPAVCGLLENCGLTTADVGPGQGTYYLAKGKTLLGVAALEHFGKAALLRSFVVAPAARKAGVGRSLLEHVLGESRRAGFSHVYLLTDTAEEYYARYGFSAIDRSQIPVEVLTLSAMGSTCPATCAAMALTL